MSRRKQQETRWVLLGIHIIRLDIKNESFWETEWGFLPKDQNIRCFNVTPIKMSLTH